MKVKDIIAHLEKTGSWVDYDHTRDQILCGDMDSEIIKMGVCWVASNKALQQAKDLGINFVISHENMFYEATTAPSKLLKQSADKKRAFCQENGITVYRCHDYWDKMPIYGVADIWAKDIGFNFKPRNVNSYNSFAEVDNLTTKEVAEKVLNAVKKYGQEGIQIVGDLDARINKLVIGTGAAININTMMKEPADAMVVSDDGIQNWILVQWALDNHVPLIIVNHASCEIGGIQQMKPYFEEVFPELKISILDEGFQIHTLD